MSSDDKLSAEDRLIADFFKPIATHPGALGLTDDAAFLTPAPGAVASGLKKRAISRSSPDA